MATSKRLQKYLDEVKEVLSLHPDAQADALESLVARAYLSGEEEGIIETRKIYNS